MAAADVFVDVDMNGHALTNAAITIDESGLSLSDVVTDNVTTARHGFAPKAPNDATKFLDGTAAYDTVKDSDLSTSDVTTNDVATTKHGFAPKLPNDATKYLDGTGTYSVPAGGGGGLGAVLFDSTLGGDAASIDTGAGGIASGYHFITAYMLLRTSQVATFSTVLVTVNNDTSSIYDLMRLQGVNATASAGNARATAQWTLDTPGASAGGSYYAYIRASCFAYDQTTAFKIWEVTHAEPDSTAANNAAELLALAYRSTTAISRMKVLAGAASNLKAGSRLTIIGW